MDEQRDAENAGENVFYFESDHLALRGNPDYTNMLRAISMLEAQKVRVHKQIEELALAKATYLGNPHLFLNKLKNGEEIIPPYQMTIVKLPEIANYKNLVPQDTKTKPEHEAGSDDLRSLPDVTTGTVKPETRLWTVEEQQRLEELLIKYPEERIEMHRFNKIAKELGNRTALQVCSRVQKYFQKLCSAGMPVPGRIPKNRRYIQTKLKHHYKPSTFFPSHMVPVHIPEDDYAFEDLMNPDANKSSEIKYKSRSGLNDASDNNVKSESVAEEQQQQIINMLKVIRQEKLTTSEGYNPDPLAAKCESCRLTPVSCVRWHCNTCYCYLNLCSDCLTYQLMEQKFEHLSHDVVTENES
uniref:HTH myb-type domain-containing protein n=1 Tax=Glossina brevipalpis TaxID=37001 RepID=A0A1A9X230_9MUSC